MDELTGQKPGRPDIADFETFGEPGAVVYLADCLDLMAAMPASCVDSVFADPPYRLSGGGVTVKSGVLSSVDKGEWDRSRGFDADHEFNLRWLSAARRVLKPEGTVWVSGTHHIIYSVGFALQKLGFRIINSIVWQKPDPPPNALHTAFTHDHETLLWASMGKGSRYTFNYDLINAPDPTGQVSSVWRLPAVRPGEKLHGRHPTQKPLRLVRRALLASTNRNALVLDPFTGSGTTAVAAKELDRFFIGAEMEREYAELAQRRLKATVRGEVLERLPRPT